MFYERKKKRILLDNIKTTKLWCIRIKHNSEI